MLENIEKHQRERLLVPAIDNLAAAVTTTNTNLAALTTAVNAAVVALNLEGPTETAIQVQADAIGQVAAALAVLTTSLNNAVNPPPPPTP